MRNNDQPQRLASSVNYALAHGDALEAGCLLKQSLDQGYALGDLATAAGKSIPALSRYLALEKLHQEVKDLYREGFLQNTAALMAMNRIRANDQETYASLVCRLKSGTLTTPEISTVATAVRTHRLRNPSKQAYLPAREVPSAAIFSDSVTAHGRNTDRRRSRQKQEHERDRISLRWIYEWGWSTSRFILKLTGAKSNAIIIRLKAEGLIRGGAVEGMSGIPRLPLHILKLTDSGVKTVERHLEIEDEFRPYDTAFGSWNYDDLRKAYWQQIAALERSSAGSI